MAFLPDIFPEEIVDLGCGAGRNAGELLKKYDRAHVTAIDYSSLSVENAAAYNRRMIEAGRCTVRRDDVYNLKLPEGNFDLATAFETICFWPGLEDCFAQVAKVIRPGGCFLICNGSDGTDNMAKRFEGIIEGTRCYTSEEIEVALKRVGFREVTSDHHPSKPRIAVLAVR